MLRLIYFALVILLSGVACSNSNTSGESTATTESKAQPELKEGWKQHEGENFLISAPESWQFDQTGRMNTKFILFAPYDSVNNFFRENINMVTEDISGQGVDLAAYIQKSQEVLAEHMINLSDVEVAKEGDRYWLNYQGDQRTLRLYFTQLFALDNEVVHIVTFTTNSDSSSNEAVAKDVMRTFRFK